MKIAQPCRANCVSICFWFVVSLIHFPDIRQWDRQEREYHPFQKALPCGQLVGEPSRILQVETGDVMILYDFGITLFRIFISIVVCGDWKLHGMTWMTQDDHESPPLIHVLGPILACIKSI